MEELSRKGIILAGGNGTRLFPLTKVCSKQLLPVHDKPMIYYPLATLMLAGIKDILIITKGSEIDLFKNLLGDGTDWGINISYKIQNSPDGIAQSFLIAEDFICESASALILGDNLFYGDNLSSKLKNLSSNKDGATILTYPVKDPERYGIVNFLEDGTVLNIEEKPKNPKSIYAITGLYFYDNSVLEKAKLLKPSFRKELEITDINKMYLEEKLLNVKKLGRGNAWLDTGTHDSLYEATSFIRTIEKRQGLKVGCPEEVAWRNGWISNKRLGYLSSKMLNSEYGIYLSSLLNK